MNGNSFIKEIGRSYIISSFLPAALFFSLGVFVFHGFVPTFILDGIQRVNSFLGSNNPSDFPLGALFILFIATSWLAFYLYSSINWTIQLFEGYKFPFILSEIMRYRLRRKWHRKQIEIYEARRQDFEKRSLAQGSDLEEVRKLALTEIQNLEGYGPIDEDDLLPTRLGNVLRASESYADERYKLNSLVVFPKLLHVFPQHFINELEDKNNRFIFLIHSSLLAYAVGLSAILLCLLHYILIPFCKTPSELQGIVRSLCDEEGFVANGFSVLSANEYFIVGLLFVAIGYSIYRVGVIAAREFALHIRAGFDLYRFELLRQLNCKLPTTLKDEKRIWELLSEYFVAGNRLRFADVRIQYHHEKRKSDQIRE